MERINLNNYEAFFLDYMEGNLNAQQEFELIDFLNKHPELKSELDMDLDELQLAPAAVSLDTGFLKREGIQPDEVDGLMAASIEGDLSAAEQTELNQYIYENELESDFKYYQYTFLTPDASIVFEDKADLKQRDRVIAPIFFQLGVAAILLGAITVGVYNYNGSENTEVADLNTTEVESETTQPLENQNSILPNIESTSDIVADNSTEETSGFSDLDSENNQFDPSSESESMIITSSFENVNGTGELVDTVSQENHEHILQDNPDSEEQLDDSDDDKLEPRDPKETIKSKEDYEKEKKKDDIVVEEPIKVFTNMAENIFNKEVSYERSTKTSTGEKVEHHVKLGRFEFQRKKH